MNDSLKSILLLLLWIFLSFLIPLGILGEIIWRKAMNRDLKDKWWTYFISTFPLFGPIINYIILH